MKPIKTDKVHRFFSCLKIKTGFKNCTVTRLAVFGAHILFAKMLAILPGGLPLISNLQPDIARDIGCCTQLMQDYLLRVMISFFKSPI